MDEFTRKTTIEKAQAFVADLERTFVNPADPVFENAYEAYKTVKALIKALSDKEN